MNLKMADGYFVSQGLRESAALCTKEQAALAARLITAADVIDAMLDERRAISKQRYEIVGLTKAEATRCLEAVAGDALWSDGHSFPSNELFARPIGCRCNFCRTAEQISYPSASVRRAG